MGPGGADLHVHSRRSDGTHEPARVVELAAERGLEGVSLTDHDTVAGLEEALGAGRRLGVRVLTGVELSAVYRDREIHLLAYGFDPTDPVLITTLRRYRSERDQRTERIVSRLRDLGVPLEIGDVRRRAGEAVLGRPHVADALLSAGHVSTFQEAFDRYLNVGAPAFVPRSRFPLARAREVVHAAGGVLILAHPHLNLSSGNIRALVEEGIDGMEVDHPRLKPGQKRELGELVREKGILRTGGSDCHGERRGSSLLGSVRVPLGTLYEIERRGRERAARRPAEEGAVSPEGGR